MVRKDTPLRAPAPMVFQTLRRRAVHHDPKRPAGSLPRRANPPGATSASDAWVASDRTGFLFRKAKSKSLLDNTLRAIMSVTSNVSSDAEVMSTCNQSINIHAKGTIRLSDSTLSNNCRNQAKAIATLKALSQPKVQQDLKDQLTSMAKSQIKGLPTSLMSSTDSDSTVRNYVEQVSQITSNSYARCSAEAKTYQSIDVDADKDVVLSDGQLLSNNASLNAVLKCVGSAVGETQAFQTLDNAVQSTAAAIDSGFDPLSWLGSLLSPQLLAMMVPIVSSCCLMLCCCAALLIISESGGGRGASLAPFTNAEKIKSAASELLKKNNMSMA